MLNLVADAHFIPQSLICPFCNFEFDMIADIDNFTSNLAFLAGQLNITVLALKASLEQVHNQALSSWPKIWLAQPNSSFPYFRLGPLMFEKM